MADYVTTRDRVEEYFDRTATRVWEQLTSDAPVSRVRATVRAGRDEMRDVLLNAMPQNLNGARILDAGCGTGAMSVELARRGAQVVGVDVSPSLIDIAQKRLPIALSSKVTFCAGDMTDPGLGTFDHAIAMDSLIYYDAADISAALHALTGRCKRNVAFTVAPRTALLMMMWRAGKLFPRADRSPTMVPHSHKGLTHALGYAPTRLGRVSSGFYISEAFVVEGRA